MTTEVEEKAAEEKTPEENRGGSSFLSRIKESGEILSLLAALVLLCIVFAIASPYFLNIRNILNVLSSTAILGIMAAGLFVAMLLGAMDVSQYAVVAFSTSIVALAARSGMSTLLVIVFGILVAIACGAFNGFAVAFMKISPIITTLGTMAIFRGFAYLLTQSRTLMVTGSFFQTIGRGRFLGIPLPIYIMAVVFLLIHVMLKYTAFGRKVFAVGGNPRASYLSGINIKMVRFFGLIVSAATAGIAGITFVSQVGAAMPNAGEAALMDVITAVILGGISLSGGKGRLIGTLIGVLILAVLQNGMVLLGVQSFYQMMIRGAVIIIAVFLDTVRGGGFK